MQIRTETRETNEKMLFYAIELKSYLYVLVQPPSQSQQNKYCMGWVGGLSEERVMSGIFTILNPKQLRGRWQLSPIQVLRPHTSSEPYVTIFFASSPTSFVALLRGWKWYPERRHTGSEMRQQTATGIELVNQLTRGNSEMSLSEWYFARSAEYRGECVAARKT